MCCSRCGMISWAAALCTGVETTVASAQRIIVLRVRDSVAEPTFLLCTFCDASRKLRSAVYRWTSTRTRPRLATGSRIYRFRLPPVRRTEMRLLQPCDDTMQIDGAIAQRIDREIDLLREYRTRLIADVVTGKLDVREAAARLPDEVEEPEPLDEADTLDRRRRGRRGRSGRRRRGGRGVKAEIYSQNLWPQLRRQPACSSGGIVQRACKRPRAADLTEAVARRRWRACRCLLSDLS